MSHILLPCVDARKVRVGLWSVTPRTVTRGKPAPRDDQIAPPFWVLNTPISEAKKYVLAKTGSITIAFTGIFGKLPVMSFQVRPPSVVRATCAKLPLKPLKPD